MVTSSSTIYVLKRNSQSDENVKYGADKTGVTIISIFVSLINYHLKCETRRTCKIDDHILGDPLQICSSLKIRKQI